MVFHLKPYVGTKQLIHVERCYSENKYINGFIHDRSRNLVLMQMFSDFMPDGYVIFSPKHIVEVRANELDQFCQSILEKEGLMKCVNYKRKIPISSYKKMLNYFIQRKENIIIESENDNEDECVFYLGRPIRIDGNKLWFACLGPDGKWEEYLSHFSIETITLIQYDTPYLNIFTKYAEEY